MIDLQLSLGHTVNNNVTIEVGDLVFYILDEDSRGGTGSSIPGLYTLIVLEEIYDTFFCKLVTLPDACPLSLVNLYSQKIWNIQKDHLYNDVKNYGGVFKKDAGDLNGE